MKLVDKYFEHPLIYDYSLGIICCIGFFLLNVRHYFELPAADNSISTTTDLSTIALTIAGFILTLLTVLITFKAGAKIPETDNYDDETLFNLFFSTRLYFDTTDLLKGAIKSLIFISMLGFTLKLLLPTDYRIYMFYSNVLGLVILGTTLYRSLLILTKILDLQKGASN